MLRLFIPPGYSVALPRQSRLEPHVFAAHISSPLMLHPEYLSRIRDSPPYPSRGHWVGERGIHSSVFARDGPPEWFHVQFLSLGQVPRHGIVRATDTGSKRG